MSAPEGTPKKLTNKEKHNRESIDKTIKREYDVVTDDDLEEPTEVIERSELNEPSVMVEMTDIPHPGELENPGKPYGSVGAIAYPITAKTASKVNVKVEKAKQGEVDEDGFVILPDTGKVVDDEGK